MTPSRLHPLSVVHFRATLFQTKGQTKPNRAHSVLFYSPTLAPNWVTRELSVCACESIPRVQQGASGEQELSLPVGGHPGAPCSQVRLPSSYAEGAGHFLPGWLAGLLLQPPIGRLAEHPNHFPVTLRPRSRCASHELRVPCGCAAAEAEAGTEVPAGLRRGIGGSMNGSGGGGGSDLSLAPGPGPGAAQDPHWCMGAAPGP